MKRSQLFTFGVLCGTLCAASVSQAALTAWWEFEEGAGATAADSSPSGVNGVITNDATGGLGAGGSVWVNDPVRGSVISFNGNGNDAVSPDMPGAFVRAGSIPLMDLTNDFTWAFWANNLEEAQPNNIVVGNRNNGETPGADFDPRQFIKFTPTKFEFHMNGNGNDNMEYGATPNAMPVDQWVHHAVVKAGAVLTYYRNGVEENTHTLVQPQFDAMPLFFGGDAEGLDGENWHGLLDDVRIYDNALSAADVGTLAGVPEPSAICLLLAGSACLLGVRRAKSRA